MNQNQKVVVITGASAGMGYAAAQLFASQGWQVFAGARRVEKIPEGTDIVPIQIDVTQSESNQNFVHEILQKTERVDVLINNAGYGEFGTAEEVPLSEIRRQFDTNFFGAVELTQLILPVMRQQRFGRIINVSSIVGNIYLPLGAYYNASKAALQQWSDVLDLEISPFGLHSIVVQPGDTASGWGRIAFDNARKNLKEQSAYQALSLAIQKQKNRPGAKVAKPDELAQLFYQAARDAKPKQRYYQSINDQLLVRLARVHPRIYQSLIHRVVKHLTKEFLV